MVDGGAEYALQRGARDKFDGCAESCVSFALRTWHASKQVIWTKIFLIDRMVLQKNCRCSGRDRATDQILELGTGTGVLTRELARHAKAGGGSRT